MKNNNQNRNNQSYWANLAFINNKKNRAIWHNKTYCCYFLQLSSLIYPHLAILIFTKHNSASFFCFMFKQRKWQLDARFYVSCYDVTQLLPWIECLRRFYRNRREAAFEFKIGGKIFETIELSNGTNYEMAIRILLTGAKVWNYAT